MTNGSAVQRRAPPRYHGGVGAALRGRRGGPLDRGGPVPVRRRVHRGQHAAGQLGQRGLFAFVGERLLCSEGQPLVIQAGRRNCRGLVPFNLTLGAQIDNDAYDAFFRLAPAEPVDLSSIILAIDERTLIDMGGIRHQRDMISAGLEAIDDA